MENTETETLQELLISLEAVRGRLDNIEAVWKKERAVSKRLTLRLVTEYGYSIFKASGVSGHHRQTILVWLNAAGYKQGR
jgi:hypothetical protein